MDKLFVSLARDPPKKIDQSGAWHGGSRNKVHKRPKRAIAKAGQGGNAGGLVGLLRDLAKYPPEFIQDDLEAVLDLRVPEGVGDGLQIDRQVIDSTLPVLVQNKSSELGCQVQENGQMELSHGGSVPVKTLSRIPSSDNVVAGPDVSALAKTSNITASSDSIATETTVLVPVNVPTSSDSAVAGLNVPTHVEASSITTSPVDPLVTLRNSTKSLVTFRTLSTADRELLASEEAKQTVLNFMQQQKRTKQDDTKERKPKRPRIANSKTRLGHSLEAQVAHELDLSKNTVKGSSKLLGLNTLQGRLETSATEDSLLVRFSIFDKNLIRAPPPPVVVYQSSTPRSNKSKHKQQKEREWRERQREQLRRAKIWSEKEKQKTCTFFMLGKCRRGSDCKNSHPISARLPLCNEVLSGKCTFGKTCPYSHNTKSEPCIHFNGPGKRCSYGDRCRFSHSTDLSKFDRESLEARLSQLSKRMETLPSTTVSGPVVYSNLAETVI